VSTVDLRVPVLGDRRNGGGHGGHIMLRRFGRAVPRRAHILRALVNGEARALLNE
jgi:hypothetical protein